MHFSAFGRLKYVFEARGETCVSGEKRSQYDRRVIVRARTRLHLAHTDPHLAYRRGRLPLGGATPGRHASSSSD